MWLIKKKARLDAMPKGYGLLWYDSLSLSIYYAPVPLNIILRLGRWVYIKLKHGIFWSKLEERESQIYTEGRREGRESLSKMIDQGFHKDYIRRDNVKEV